MGGGFSKDVSEVEAPSPTKKHVDVIRDRFRTIDEVNSAVRRAGLDSSNLIVGIDFSKSNCYTGRVSFDGRSLHHIEKDTLNPYQRVLTTLRNTLEVFDDDKLIPCFGFGAAGLVDGSVFPFYADRICYGFDEVLHRYSELSPNVMMGGGTTYAGIIHQAILIVKELKAYHILLIISDGQVVDERSTVDAIVEASRYPLSIIMIGVGDGPWVQMAEFDDQLPKRKFDNFQFVQFHKVMQENNGEENAFAVHALMEIPEQFRTIQRKGLLSSMTGGMDESSKSDDK